MPLYAGALSAEGESKAKAFADEALSFLVFILIAVSLVSILFMPWLMLILAPGFADDPAKYDLTVLLTRITMPYILFISVISLLGGILNSFHKFAAVAATPILMNLCLLIVPALIEPFLPSFAHALAVAVFVAGVVQMLWLIYFCMRLKVMPRLKMPRLTAEVRKLFRLIAPAALGAGVAQVNLFIDLIIASSMDGAVSYLYYADRINELPLAVIGIAVGTVLLPSLSKLVREGKREEALHSQNRALELALFFSLPASAALICITTPIVRVLYERGEFGGAETLAVVPALMAFAAGLPAFVLIKVLAPAFYANRDTKTPFLIATLCIAVNLILNLALIGTFRHVGMAMATSIAGWLNIALMLAVLRKRGLFAPDRLLLKRLPRMGLSTALMVAALLALEPALAIYWGGDFMVKAAALSALVAVGIGAYGLSALAVGAVDAARLRGMMKKGG